MAKEGSVTKYLLIIAFAACIVMLGTKELNRRYVRGSARGGASGSDLVKELHGQFDILRGRLGQSEVASSSNEEPENTPEPKREGRSFAPTPQRSSKESSPSRGEDKEQLQKVIDSLVP